jgi:hypothetical protein
MCRTPDIVPWWPEGYGPDKPYLLDGEPYQHYRCDSCWRGVQQCPRCQQRRCDSDLFLSMVGSFPLACRFCAADVEQTYALGPEGGIYSGGGELRYHIVPLAKATADA